MSDSEDEQIVWQGRFITAKTRGKWEYVSRARGIKAAVILAVDDGDVLGQLQPVRARDRHRHQSLHADLDLSLIHISEPTRPY